MSNFISSSTLLVTYHPGFVTEVVDRMQRVNTGDSSILQPNDQTAVVSITCHAEGMLADQHKVWLQRPGLGTGIGTLSVCVCGSPTSQEVPYYSIEFLSIHSFWKLQSVFFSPHMHKLILLPGVLFPPFPHLVIDSFSDFPVCWRSGCNSTHWALASPWS